MTKEERDLLLDITQMLLDLTGIIDPTPVSDGASLSLSIARADWLGAGLSGIALIPYVGDVLAKTQKLPRWSKTVGQAIELSNRNAQIGAVLRPKLRSLSNILDQIPPALLPGSASCYVESMKRQLKGLRGATQKTVPKVLAERYLRAWFRYIDNLPLQVPAAGKGALWAKLGGWERANNLAMADGRRTLESCLPKDFQQRFDVAFTQLAEQFGGDRNIVWREFGRPVWERISRRFVNNLSGEVTAYVSFHGSRNGSATGIFSDFRAGGPSSEPVLYDELEEIAELMHANPRISVVTVVDVETGQKKYLNKGSTQKN